ncbi:Mediator of RNA polymerase II transcription subunit 17 [Platanthera guangdongensis]|uniref:Mediator of RNA polymerase II transcription subunit 17 n=1 Tax=Platanthera guangdongensis TaxID=2320717 RepID=A0ABR2MXD4_9ASPA
MNMEIDLDKLPLKRLEAIDEAGNEQFPLDIGYEEKRLNMVRRIDFSSVVEERDAKKQKNSKEAAGTQPWPWQSLVENLQVAQQELSIILDLINTVEANDAVTVAGMQRPKQLPHESLSDIVVSSATKLQRLRHLGRYFKQSSKALEQQVTRETRFYDSLIRLQQNWKVKRQHVGISVPGSESCFTIDLLHNSMTDLVLSSRSSILSTVHIDQDHAGVLTVKFPLRLCRRLSIEFPGFHSNHEQKSFQKGKVESVLHTREDEKMALAGEDVNEHVKDSHLILREMHRSIFQEQVFNLVNQKSYNYLPGVNVISMQDDCLQLSIGHGTYVSFRLLPSLEEEPNEKMNSNNQPQNRESGIRSTSSLGSETVDEKSYPMDYLNFPDPASLEIFLQYLFHEGVFLKFKERRTYAPRLVMPSQPTSDGCNFLGHFCMTISHRIFSMRVMSMLEGLVARVPYLHLHYHPTWHSRISSWCLSLKVPLSILHSRRRIKPSESNDLKRGFRSHFHTKVVLNGDQINVSGEGTHEVGSLRGDFAAGCLINCYSCDLVDLPMVILQQVAGQVIHWLHEEALIIGLKVSRDFLCLWFSLDQGDKLGLVANVNAGDIRGCISWWLVFDDSSMEEGKLGATDDGERRSHKFLGNLSLETLYSTLMDLVSLSVYGGGH